MSKKNSLALFLVLVIISSTSYWTPENELREIREFYAPVEIDNGNGTWTLQYQDDGSGGFSDAVISSANPSMVDTTSSIIEISSDPQNGTEQRALFGIDLSTVGFMSNISIISASLELTIDTAPSNATNIMGLMTYRDWVDPSWNGATPAVSWTCLLYTSPSPRDS